MRNTYHLSSSQRNKLIKTFFVGNSVEFDLSKDGKVTNINKCAEIRKLYLSSDGKHVVRVYLIILELLPFPTYFLVKLLTCFKFILSVNFVVL